MAPMNHYQATYAREQAEAQGAAVARLESYLLEARRDDARKSTPATRRAIQDLKTAIQEARARN